MGKLPSDMGLANWGNYSSDMGLANGSTKEKHGETFSFRVTWAWLMGVRRKNMGKLLASE